MARRLVPGESSCGEDGQRQRVPWTSDAQADWRLVELREAPLPRRRGRRVWTRHGRRVYRRGGRSGRGQRPWWRPRRRSRSRRPVASRSNCSHQRASDSRRAASSRSPCGPPRLPRSMKARMTSWGEGAPAAARSAEGPRSVVCATGWSSSAPRRPAVARLSARAWSSSAAPSHSGPTGGASGAGRGAAVAAPASRQARSTAVQAVSLGTP